MEHDSKERKEQVPERAGAEKNPEETKDKALSADELEAVSGGERNWLLDGCAATVEPGSDCWGTDLCDMIIISYESFVPEYKCPGNTGPHSYEVVNREVNHDYSIPRVTVTYRCKYCGDSYQETSMRGMRG